MIAEYLSVALKHAQYEMIQDLEPFYMKSLVVSRPRRIDPEFVSDRGSSGQRLFAPVLQERRLGRSFRRQTGVCESLALPNIHFLLKAA